MNSETEDCFQRLVAMDPAIETSLKDLLASWLPDSPPVTIVFAQIGDVIADHVSEMSDEVQRNIFAEVERGMNSSVVELRNATATGLIEAIVGKADRQPGLFDRFVRLMGPASASHAIAWRQFGQSTESDQEGQVS